MKRFRVTYVEPSIRQVTLRAVSVQELRRNWEEGDFVEAVAAYSYGIEWGADEIREVVELCPRVGCEQALDEQGLCADHNPADGPDYPADGVEVGS